MAWTASQLCAYACNRAKAPGFLTKAGDHLNAILQELAATYDFEINKVLYNFNFNTALGIGPYPLPLNFLRMEEGEAGPELFFTILGVPYPLRYLDQSEFDRLVETPGLSNYPEAFTVDLTGAQPLITAGNLYVWMPPSGAYPVTMRYYSMPADIANPSTSSVVPWFPVSTYLQNRLTSMMCEEVNDDERAMYFDAKAEKILERYLPQADNGSVKTHTVKLDERRFGKSWSSLPNTKAFGW